MFENLYIHVPFCSTKCGYCSFYSLPQSDVGTMQKYMTALERELEEFSRGETLNSVYFGGGTPTFLPLPLLENLLTAVSTSYHLAPGAEVSMECNPETVSPIYVDIMQTIVNRVSMGVQSFSPRLRKVLGRRGCADEIEDAVKQLRRGGIENIGLDLIYAIPGQTMEEWLLDLRRAVDTGVSHLSCYSLTVEPGTPMHEEFGDNPVDEGLSAEMWHATGDFLHDFGLERYEVSNYALPNWECRHNMNVWHGRSYLGLGPAASSFNGLNRWTEPPCLAEWLSGSAPVRDELSPEARAREVFAFGLRTAAGWTETQWQSLAPQLIVGSPWKTLIESTPIKELGQKQLLAISPERIKPTSLGMAFWDDVAAALI